MPWSPWRSPSYMIQQKPLWQIWFWRSHTARSSKIYYFILSAEPRFPWPLIISNLNTTAHFQKSVEVVPSKVLANAWLVLLWLSILLLCKWTMKLHLQKRTAGWQKAGPNLKDKKVLKHIIPYQEVSVLYLTVMCSFRSSVCSHLQWTDCFHLLIHMN